MLVKEKEIKILDIDPIRLANKIICIGGVSKGEHFLRDTFYDLKDDSNMVELKKDKFFKEIFQTLDSLKTTYIDIKDSGIFIRLREVDKFAEFTLKVIKNKSSEISNNLEYNIELKTPTLKNHFNKIEKMALKKIAVHEKRRSKFIIESESINIDIDQYPTLPVYTEIEGDSAKSINNIIKVLDLTGKRTTNLTGAGFFNMFKVNFYSQLIFKNGDS